MRVSRNPGESVMQASGIGGCVKDPLPAIGPGFSKNPAITVHSYVESLRVKE